MYLWLVLCVGRYKERWNLELKLMPVLLGAVHAMTGNSMPSRVPAKGLLIHLYIQSTNIPSTQELLKHFTEIHLYIWHRIYQTCKRKSVNWNMCVCVFVLYMDIAARWLTEDAKRNTLFMNVPFQGNPAAFGTESFNTILCQRVLTAIAEKKVSTFLIKNVAGHM